MKIIKYIIFIIGLILISIGVLISNHNKSNNPLKTSWLELSGSLIIIKNNNFYWYKDYTNLKDNYYKGKIEYRKLNSYNYSKKYLKEKYGDINPNLFYIIKVYPTKLVINKKKKYVNKKYPLSFELILEDNFKEGIMYSKDLLKTYEIIKYGIN